MSALEAVPSDVVCFIPRDDDRVGAHAPVMFGENYGAFPPNTLFRFAGEKAPGEWVGPGGVRPKQRLLLVTATYRRATMSFEERIASKMTGTAVTLSYGDREAFVSGLNDLLATPTLTMALEFERDLEWRDWKGAAYTLRDEWAYVNGAALPKEGCTPGTRDKGNAGKTPDDFMAEVNAFIAAARSQPRDGPARGPRVPDAR